MKTYLNRNGVTVDSGKIYIHGTRYPLTSISTYNIMPHSSHKFDWKKALKYTAYWGVGSFILFCIITFYVSQSAQNNILDFLFYCGIASILVATAVLYMMHDSMSPRITWISSHSLNITTAGTDKAVLHTTDQHFLNDVIHALDEATSER